MNKSNKYFFKKADAPFGAKALRQASIACAVAQSIVLKIDCSSTPCLNGYTIHTGLHDGITSE